MASPSNRSPSAPGRHPTVARPGDGHRGKVRRVDPGASDAVEDSGRVAQVVATAGKRGARVTWRLVAVLIVFAILVVTYANSLRVYFSQQRQIADAKAQVAAGQRSVNDLYDQLERWQDPAYVKAQARAQLGWVMPGEIGFHVIGPDGQVLGGGATVSSTAALPPGEQPRTWWDQLAGSFLTADDPTPVPDATPQDPITVKPPG